MDTPSSANPAIVNTIKEYDKWHGVDNAPVLPTLLQLGSEACVRCPAFKIAIRDMQALYKFRWAYSDVHNDDADLPEHFGITKLPAFVFNSRDGINQPIVMAGARIDQMRKVVRDSCTPILLLDEDF